MKLCNLEINITKEQLFKLVQKDNGFRGRAKIVEWFTCDNDEDCEECKEFCSDEFVCNAFVSNTENYYCASYGTFYYSHSAMLSLLRKNGYIKD